MAAAGCGVQEVAAVTASGLLPAKSVSPSSMESTSSTRQSQRGPSVTVADWRSAPRSDQRLRSLGEWLRRIVFASAKIHAKQG